LGVLNSNDGLIQGISCLATLRRHDDARSFIRGLMQTTINLRPDLTTGEPRIEIHGQANAIHDTVVAHLCDELNPAETHHPGTKRSLRDQLLKRGSRVSSTR